VEVFAGNAACPFSGSFFEGLEVGRGMEGLGGESLLQKKAERKRQGKKRGAGVKKASAAYEGTGWNGC